MNDKEYNDLVLRGLIDVGRFKKLEDKTYEEIERMTAAQLTHDLKGYEEPKKRVRPWQKYWFFYPWWCWLIIFTLFYLIHCTHLETARQRTLKTEAPATYDVYRPRDSPFYWTCVFCFGEVASMTMFEFLHDDTPLEVYQKAWHGNFALLLRFPLIKGVLFVKGGENA